MDHDQPLQVEGILVERSNDEGIIRRAVVGNQNDVQLILPSRTVLHSFIVNIFFIFTDIHTPLLTLSEEFIPFLIEKFFSLGSAETKRSYTAISSFK